MIGTGDAVWRRAAQDLLRWRIKTGSGFRVSDDAAVSPGDRVSVTATVLGLTVVEPVEVIAVVDTPERVGFAYRTLPGHPLRGEEAFILQRDHDQVRLTVRSLSRPAPRQPWRALYPLLLLAQRFVHRRYLRALG